MHSWHRFTQTQHTNHNKTYPQSQQVTSAHLSIFKLTVYYSQNQNWRVLSGNFRWSVLEKKTKGTSITLTELLFGWSNNPPPPTAFRLWIRGCCVQKLSGNNNPTFTPTSCCGWPAVGRWERSLGLNSKRSILIIYTYLCHFCVYNNMNVFEEWPLFTPPLSAGLQNNCKHVWFPTRTHNKSYILLFNHNTALCIFQQFVALSMRWLGLEHNELLAGWKTKQSKLTLSLFWISFGSTFWCERTNLYSQRVHWHLPPPL